ncbi:uncharacterized protein LOC124656718 [Lolium rigidum]|uniref:uncharacterized protein LOC124656718 n=1 Tax=Lolium rigidum TaxID=89674 RepID=UPI001F5D6FF5|nr:uncharacterized protein LOC124656718 [Lolium rigidum]
MTAGRHGGRAGGRLHRLLLAEVRPEVLLPASSSSGNLARDLLMLATTRSRCIQDHSRQQTKQLLRVMVGCRRGLLCCRDGGGEARMMNQCSPAMAAAPAVWPELLPLASSGDNATSTVGQHSELPLPREA